jgi:hypothetical protein
VNPSHELDAAHVEITQNYLAAVLPKLS